MFLARIRFALAFVALGIGIWLQFTQSTLSAIPLYFLAVVLLVVHFLFNNVSAALIALKRGNLEEADNLIYSVKKPEWLVKQHRGYYYFTKGMIATQRNLPNEAVEDLKIALSIGLRSANDNALAAINIAHITFKDQPKVAKEFLEKAKSFQTDDLMIKEHINKLNEALKNA